MEFVNDIPPQHQQLQNSIPGPKLQVNFSLRRNKATITDTSNPSQPAYVVGLKSVRSPHVIVKSGNKDRLIGTGTLHAVSINADYEVHGQKGILKALKRFHTEYTHLSRALTDDNGAPVAMTWTSSCGFKTWDFVCTDAQRMPVARFSANEWAIKKVGTIEFVGPKAASAELRDELVVTGLTLFYCIVLRSNNVLSLFGAVFAKPGPLDGTETT